MKKSSSILITVLCLLFLSCSTIKTPPPGVDFESKEYHSEIAEFKYDLSYLTKDGDAAHDTHIFNKVYKNIDLLQQLNGCKKFGNVLSYMQPISCKNIFLES